MFYVYNLGNKEQERTMISYRGSRPLKSRYRISNSLAFFAQKEDEQSSAVPVDDGWTSAIRMNTWNQSVHVCTHVHCLLVFFRYE